MHTPRPQTKPCMTGAVLQALGGRVPMLAEAWEAQQKYGGVSGRVTKKEIHNMGPAFSHFDPTRGRQKGMPPRPPAAVHTQDSQARAQQQSAPSGVPQDTKQAAEPAGALLTSSSPQGEKEHAALWHRAQKASGHQDIYVYANCRTIPLC